METVRFGRSGLDVSVAGLGGGGDSRLGLGTGGDFHSAVAVVHRALDLGITFFDTAQSYGTESILGEGLSTRRSEIVLSTKVSPRLRDGGLLSPQDLRQAVEKSLAALNTDFIDLYHLHRVRLADYDYCVAELLPELHRMRDAGKIRYIGLSETTSDPRHLMLGQALDSDHWDAVMCTFTILNQSAREVVLQKAIMRDVAVEVMSAARGPISHPEDLPSLVAQYLEAGTSSGEELDAANPLEFLIANGGGESLIEVAYRFARHEPGCHVVLTGTGDTQHLAENVKAITGPPLRAADLDRIRNHFGGLRYATPINPR